MLAHHRDGRTHRAELPPEVYPDHDIPLVFGQFPERLRRGHDRCVAHESVEAAEALDCCLHHALPARDRRNVVVNRDRFAAELVDFSDDLIGGGLGGCSAAFAIAAEVGHHDPRAFLGKLECERAADTPSGPGDRDAFALESVSHGVCILCFNLSYRSCKRHNIQIA